MYLTIILLPLLGSIFSGLLGRYLGVTGVHFITCLCTSLSCLIAIIAFYEVGLCHSPISLDIGC